MRVSRASWALFNPINGFAAKLCIPGGNDIKRLQPIRKTENWQSAVTILAQTNVFVTSLAALPAIACTSFRRALATWRKWLPCGRGFEGGAACNLARYREGPLQHARWSRSYGPRQDCAGFELALNAAPSL